MDSDVFGCLPSVRAVTQLYGLKPQGLGTGQVESLQSYLLSLAHAHRVSPYQLAARVLAPLRRSIKTAIHVRLDWTRHAGKRLLGATDNTEDWLHMLGRATGRVDLVYTTLYPLGAYINAEGLFSSAYRHCPQCLLDDIANNRPTYRRLLWHLAVVTCCPVHATSLVESSCGRPATEHLSPRTRKLLGGVCPSCGAVGYGCVTSVVADANDEELWKARQCELLLGRLPTLKSTNLLGAKAAVRTYTQADKRGIAGVAERAGISKSLLWRWIHTPSARLSLGGYLQLAAAGGWSLIGLLTADLATEGEAHVVRTGRRRPEHRALDDGVVRRRLEQGINESVSITRIARELQVSPRILRARYPQLCAAVAQRVNERLIRECNEIQDNALREAEAVLLTLNQLGRPPTLRNAGELTGKQWFPAQLRTRLFGALRTELDAAALQSVHKYELDVRMESAMTLARERLRAAIQPKSGSRD